MKPVKLEKLASPASHLSQFILDIEIYSGFTLPHETMQNSVEYYSKKLVPEPAGAVPNRT